MRGQDDYGRNQLAGYGTVFVPTAPGTHEVVVQCWRPRHKSSMWTRLKRHLLGTVPEFVDDKKNLTWENNRSRAGILTEDTVEVLVRFNVLMQEFERNNLAY